MPPDTQHADMTPTSTGEVVLKPRDLFFSRTDARGVIAEGNSTFQRISGYDWDDLKGAPHKIVRHEDMPKGVFWLFWNRLKAGKRVVAYVKNRTKQGRPYWVLALAWPVDGGYLSVRLMPGSRLFTDVKAVYATLLDAEASDNLDPEASTARLVEALRVHGFRSYDSFMATALSTELAQRAETLGTAVPERIGRFIENRQTIDAVLEETDRMADFIKEIRSVPINMRIAASRMENAGGPISAISVNYSQMLDEMATWVRDFISGDACALARIVEAIEQGQLAVCASALQDEMSNAFDEDMHDGADLQSLDASKQMMRGHARDFAISADKALMTLETEAARLGRGVLDLKRFVTGLGSTRMMCKIESAMIPKAQNALDGIVDQLDVGQDEIESRLAHIMELNATLQNNTALMQATG